MIRERQPDGELPPHGPFRHMERFGPDEHIGVWDIISERSKDGYSILLQFKDKVWLLTVYETTVEQFRIVEHDKSA